MCIYELLDSYVYSYILRIQVYLFSIYSTYITIYVHTYVVTHQATFLSLCCNHVLHVYSASIYVHKPDILIPVLQSGQGYALNLDDSLTYLHTCDLEI